MCLISAEGSVRPNLRFGSVRLLPNVFGVRSFTSNYNPCTHSLTSSYHWNRREPLNVGQNPMTLNEQEERSFCACAEGYLIIDEINFRHVYVSWRMRSNNDPPAHMR